MDLSQLADYEARASSGDLDDVLLGEYRVVRELGRGTFGRVVLAQRSTGELAAIKILPRGTLVERYRTYVAREILHQASLRHPFVVSLKEVVLTPRNLGIAMEYASGGNLLDYMKTRVLLSEAEARWMFQQLIIGLAYCHDRGVANRDLKLENLLLDRRASASATTSQGDWPLLKICDFGYSKHEQNSTAKTGVGTPCYMAPEVIAGTAKYSAKRADIWSCGVILYTLLFGAYPFNPDSKQCAMAIVTGKWAVPPGTAVSAEAQHLLHQLMTVDPLMRIEIPGILAHPWFKRALPEGADAMNAFYLADAPNLDEAVPRVKHLVQLAQREGVPGEAAQSVVFPGGSSSPGAG